ncbi:MAG: hypothetical protein MI924_26890 [Chloroflexales bacterium]|nr:hypothetical protein [Chloroflexales bacterium]
MKDKCGEQNKPDMQAPTNTLSRRQFLRMASLLAGGSITSATLAACTAADPSEVSQSAAQSAPTVLVRQKPVIFLESTEPETLDPQFGESGVSANVFSNIFEALTDYNRVVEFKPRLAKSYYVLYDKVTWRFKLREGIKFWNGESFNTLGLLTRSLTNDILTCIRVEDICYVMRLNVLYKRSQCFWG